MKDFMVGTYLLFAVSIFPRNEICSLFTSLTSRRAVPFSQISKLNVTALSKSKMEI